VGKLVIRQGVYDDNSRSSKQRLLYACFVLLAQGAFLLCLLAVSWSWGPWDPPRCLL
jgi:hypothetical protein